MNRKFQIAVALISCLSFAHPTFAQITFERSYGGQFYDTGEDVVETPDHNYLVFGTTRSVSNDTTDAYLLRLDENGDTLWTKAYGGKLWDSGIAIVPASDGGYVLGIATNSINPENYDVHLVKIQDNGDTLWTRTYGGSATDYVHSMQSTSDDGYIVLAHTLSYGKGSLDFYLLKLDENGDTLWTRTYGDTGSDWGGFVQQTSDDGYIMTGDTYSFGDPNGDIYLIKTNISGDTLWTRTYGGADYDRAYHVLQTTDGGFMVSGITQSLGAADYNGYLIRTNTSGDTLWTKVIGGMQTSSLYWCEQISDGNYVAAGSIRGIGVETVDAYIIKFDDDGNILWTRNFGGAEHDMASCVKETKDGGLIIVGRTKSFAVGQDDDVYIIKTNNAGNFTSIRDIRSTLPPSSNELLECYPNPFHSSTRITFKLNKADNVSLRIVSLLGKEIETLLSDKYLSDGEYDFPWSADHLPGGLYVIQLKVGNNIFTQNIICQR